MAWFELQIPCSNVFSCIFKVLVEPRHRLPLLPNGLLYVSQRSRSHCSRWTLCCPLCRCVCNLPSITASAAWKPCRGYRTAFFPKSLSISSCVGHRPQYPLSYLTCFTICCASLLPNSRCVFSGLVQPVLDGCTVAPPRSHTAHPAGS
jgi:hypothetical protein